MATSKLSLLQRTVNKLVDLYGLRGAARKTGLAASTFTRIRNGTIKAPDAKTLAKLGLEMSVGIESHQRRK